MSQPFQDCFSITFHSFADMMSYHAKQAKESQWERVDANSIKVEPLDEASPLYGSLSAFDGSVTEDALKDTARNLGLAISLTGTRYPVRAIGW